MKTTLLSSKNQITLPKVLSQQVGIGYRSRVSLHIQDRAIVIKPIKSSVVEEIAGSLTQDIPKKLRGVSASEALKRIRARVATALEKDV